MGIIFDLDQTLIDSSIAEAHRSRGAFKDVYPLIPGFKLYDGMEQVFEFIKDHEIRTCIVTSSPSVYCNKVTSHWDINVDFKVCYHDTLKRKPYPDPILKAIEHMKVTYDKVLSIGDRDIDITASHNANVASVACLWGAADRKSLLATKPTYIAKVPADLIDLMTEFFNLDVN